jgi:hypothetical protein
VEEEMAKEGTMAASTRRWGQRRLLYLAPSVRMISATISPSFIYCDECDCACDSLGQSYDLKFTLNFYTFI